jgi:predicted porin
MTISSRLALLTTAGLLLSGQMSANAADLGGGCCADLEERVAELEATTARKGNRVVSLQIYGQVNKALLFFDDGVDSDVFVVDPDSSGSNFGLKGSAKIQPGLSVGYTIELDVQDSASDKVTQSNDEGVENEILIRHNYIYIESETFGRLSLGHTSTGADNAIETNLAGAIRTSNIHVGNNLFIQGSAGNLQLKHLATNFDAGRDDVVRYDTPSIYGFILSASMGDNDYADLALRFKKEWNSVRIAAAIGYQWDSSGDNSAIAEKDFEALGGSVSVMHVPTGLYGSFAAGTKDIEDAIGDQDREASFWYVQFGIERKLLPYGATTLYGEYGHYDDIATLFRADTIDSEATRWGFGVVQKIDSAAMEVYAQATFWSFEQSVFADETERSLDLEDLSMLMIGSRIKF